jgi:hypothetical protein
MEISPTISRQIRHWIWSPTPDSRSISPGSVWGGGGIRGDDCSPRSAIRCRFKHDQLRRTRKDSWKAFYWFRKSTNAQISLARSLPPSSLNQQRWGRKDRGWLLELHRSTHSGVEGRHRKSDYMPLALYDYFSWKGHDPVIVTCSWKKNLKLQYS